MFRLIHNPCIMGTSKICRTCTGHIGCVSELILLSTVPNFILYIYVNTLSGCFLDICTSLTFLFTCARLSLYQSYPLQCDDLDASRRKKAITMLSRLCILKLKYQMPLLFIYLLCICIVVSPYPTFCKFDIYHMCPYKLMCFIVHDIVNSTSDSNFSHSLFSSLELCRCRIDKETICCLRADFAL